MNTELTSLNVKRMVSATMEESNYSLETTEQPYVVLVTNKTSGKSYRVMRNSCSCPDSQNRGTRCKHQVMAEGHWLKPEVVKALRDKAKADRNLLWD